MVKMLTVLVSTISISKVFLLKNVTTHFFFRKNINVHTIFNNQSFIDILTNNIIILEQLSPGLHIIRSWVQILLEADLNL